MTAKDATNVTFTTTIKAKFVQSSIMKEIVKQYDCNIKMTNSPINFRSKNKNFKFLSGHSILFNMPAKCYKSPTHKRKPKCKQAADGMCTL